MPPKYHPYGVIKPAGSPSQPQNSVAKGVGSIGANLASSSSSLPSPSRRSSISSNASSRSSSATKPQDIEVWGSLPNDSARVYRFPDNVDFEFAKKVWADAEIHPDWFGQFTLGTYNKRTWILYSFGMNAHMAGHCHKILLDAIKDSQMMSGQTKTDSKKKKSPKGAA